MTECVFPTHHPLKLVVPPPGVHEEIGHRGYLQTELFGDGGLHLLGRPLGLLEDSVQRAALDVGEDETRLFGRALLRLLLLLLLLFAGCKRHTRETWQ